VWLPVFGKRTLVFGLARSTAGDRNDARNPSPRFPSGDQG